MELVTVYTWGKDEQIKIYKEKATYWEYLVHKIPPGCYVCITYQNTADMYKSVQLRFPPYVAFSAIDRDELPQAFKTYLLLLGVKNG